MRPGWTLVGIAVWALTGCGGDDADCAIATGEASGAMASPAAVAEPAGCVAGGVVDADLSGRWHQWIDTTPPAVFRFSFPVLEASCGSGLALPGWADDYPEVRTEVSADGLFWRRAYTDDEGIEHVEATRACVTADGSLAATVVRCQALACDSQPARLTRFDRIAGESEGDGLRLLGESTGTGGDAWSLNVRVRGGYAYVAQRPGMLRIFDVRDPAAPTEVGVYVAADAGDSSNFNDVKLVEAGERRYAVLAGRATPIIDVTDPTAPVAVREIGEYSHSVFIDEQDGRQRLHLATYGRDVPVFDITDPLAPAPLGRAQGPEDMATHDLFADDGLLYANGIDGQFVVIDARSNIGQATVLGSVPALASHAVWVATVGDRRLAFHGDEGRTAHLRNFDADPASATFLTELGSWQTRPEVSIHNIMLVGDAAYIAHYQDGIRVVDVSDPTAPRTRAYFNTWDTDTGDIGAFSGAVGLDVDPATGMVYVADLRRGLLVLSP
jgi:hypothetical protein